MTEEIKTPDQPPAKVPPEPPKPTAAMPPVDIHYTRNRIKAMDARKAAAAK